MKKTFDFQTTDLVLRSINMPLLAFCEVEARQQCVIGRSDKLPKDAKITQAKLGDKFMTGLVKVSVEFEEGEK